MLVGTVAGMSRRAFALVAVVAAAALCAVCVVAVVDHTHKHRQRVEARRATFLCVHRKVECGGRDPAAIESAWNRRERIYIAAAVALGAGVIVSLAGAIRTRPPAA